MKLLKRALKKTLEYSLVLLLFGGASLLYAHSRLFKSLIVYGPSGIIIRAASQIDNNGSMDVDGLSDLDDVDIDLSAVMNIDGALVDIGGGSYATANGDNDLGVAGDFEVDGIIDSDGGITFPTATSVIWATGGAVLSVTGGNDTTPSSGPRWFTEVQIPSNMTLTGIAFLVGSVGGTDSVVVDLYNSAGTLVASSINDPTSGPAAIVAATATIQSVPFTSTYAASNGTFYISIAFNGTTARFRTYLVPGSKFVADTQAGTFRTAASITPGTSFTVNEGPIAMVY